MLRIIIIEQHINRSILVFMTLSSKLALKLIFVIGVGGEAISDNNIGSDKVREYHLVIATHHFSIL